MPSGGDADVRRLEVFLPVGEGGSVTAGVDGRTWLHSSAPLQQVGVEGHRQLRAAPARHLAEHDVPVIKVARPNRQVRRRRGNTDVVDAIAAAPAVLPGEATRPPK
jgi:hypothetical protein